ncbi:MAG: hypothetical protein HYY78_13005 [Betaproteobacteria bacterium]|nr:hypothetical protein [Betaproteobacteria bacterium]
MSWKADIDEIHRRRKLAEACGGPDAVAKQHAEGRLTVRERIARLLDKGSFREVGKLASRASCDSSGKLVAFEPAPYVMGIGRIDGRPVAVGGEDYTIRAGTGSGSERRKGGQGGFINALLAFSSLAPTRRKPTQDVVLFGNGGGASVLGVDSFARAGPRVRRFGETTLRALREFKAQPGTSVENPIDAPVGAMQQDDGRVVERILGAVYATARPDALVMHLSMPAFSGRTKTEVLDNLVAAALGVQARYADSGKFVLVLRSDGDAQIEERKRRFRDRAISLGIPVYDELEDAARALSAFARYERFARSGCVQGLPRAEQQTRPTHIIAAARQRQRTSLDEADMNPLIVSAAGALAVDARFDLT